MQRLELVLELETNYNREPAVPVEQSGGEWSLQHPLQCTGSAGRAQSRHVSLVTGAAGGREGGGPTTLLLVRQKTAEPGLLTQTEPASLSPPVASRI